MARSKSVTGLERFSEQSRATLKEHRSSRIRRAALPHLDGTTHTSGAGGTVKTPYKTLFSASRSMFLEGAAGTAVASAALRVPAAGPEQSSTHTAEFYTSICSSFVVYVLYVLACNAQSRGFDGRDR